MKKLSRFHLTQLDEYGLTTELMKQSYDNKEKKLIDDLLYFNRIKTTSASLCLTYLAEINHPFVRIAKLN